VVSSYGGNDEVDVGRGADRLADAATTPSSVARPRLPRRPVHVRREDPGEDRIVATTSARRRPSTATSST